MENLCNLCPRACKIDRSKSNGFCNEGNFLRIAKIIKNFEWEEPGITGKKGALAIFFSGCNLRCNYCQNYEISRGQVGKIYSIEDFCKLIEENQDEHSFIDLITPTHFSDALLQAFEKIDKKIPVIWNTNSYETVENIRKVSKFVDVFLADLKYATDVLGKKFSACSDYFSKSILAIKEMCNQKPDIEIDDIMKQGVILRHLVLPNYIDNSFKVLDFIKQKFPTKKISLMSQFTPNANSTLNRKLTPLEYKAVVAHLEKLSLSNGYIQGFDSANEQFIPDFDQNHLT